MRNDLAVDLPVIDRSSTLVADPGLDSVAYAIAFVAIDERLEARLSERELIECETVGNVVRTVSVTAVSNSHHSKDIDCNSNLMGRQARGMPWRSPKSPTAIV